MRIHLHCDVDLAFSVKRVREGSEPFRSDCAMTSSPVDDTMSAGNFITMLTGADNTLPWASLVAYCEPFPAPLDEIVDAKGLDVCPNVRLYEEKVQVHLASKLNAAFPYSASCTSKECQKDRVTNNATMKFTGDCFVCILRNPLNQKRDLLLGAKMRRNGAQIAKLHH